MEGIRKNGSSARAKRGFFFRPAGLPELHAHLGSSISPQTYWHIAHTEGYKLPKREYHEFVDHLILDPGRKMTLKEYLDKIYHPILDRLSSGAMALEKGIYDSLSGAYRSNNITLLELRGNPMKHNHDGEVDLDHAIMAMLRGMEKALLEYPRLRAGIIFCLDRQFTHEKNRIIVDKAIKYHRRGVIGIDFSNYNPHTFHFRDYVSLVEKARKNGLKITSHSGETDDTNDMWECIDSLKPDRIGHGIKAVHDKKLMKKIAELGIVLEICPLSNLMTRALKDNRELKHVLQTFYHNGIKFCINTDWPEMIRDAHLSKQYEYLLKNKIMTEAQLEKTVTWAFEATFINLPNKNGNLYL
ncbi:adenosine deaminase [Candidatus Roizmanbacteria bacterium]|jgi:adenosine deaminase|nr:adenosine deaminase [Candidatus Roizmanbacteria bacterium]